MQICYWKNDRRKKKLKHKYINERLGSSAAVADGIFIKTTLLRKNRRDSRSLIADSGKFETWKSHLIKKFVNIQFRVEIREGPKQQ